MKPQIYKRMIADLERELLEIDRDLESVEERRSALEARRREVAEGIDGLKLLIDEKGAI